MTLRLVFAGTPEFAVPALDAVAGAGHVIAAVYTQPDRPAGRGRHLQPTLVARRAGELGLPLRKPERFTAEAITELAALEPDAIVVVAYGLILPPAVLTVPRLGCFNIHASLLPRWRGAAPIQRALLAGDHETGITIMRMDDGLDTGPMLLQEKIGIPEPATAGALQGALAPLGARLIVTALEQLERGTAREAPQPAAGITHARKITKDEARLDWSLPAVELERRVRAFNPAPIAWAALHGERVRVLRAHAERHAPASAAGAILGAGPDGIRVATASGALVITELQWPGGRRLTAQQATAGRHLTGERFG